MRSYQKYKNKISFIRRNSKLTYNKETFIEKEHNIHLETEILKLPEESKVTFSIASYKQIMSCRSVNS